MALLLFIGSAACVQTQAAVLDVTARRAPIGSDGVKIFPDTGQIDQSWETVAMLSSTGSTGWTSVAGMMNSQRQKAAQVGANGVVLGKVNEPGAGAKVAGAFLGTGTERNGDAIAIWIPADTARVSRACEGTRNRSAGAQ